MNLTVLGNNGTCPAKDGACSSYLLEVNNQKILIDMGNGSLAKLQHLYNLEDINIIIISHLHFDHFADIVPYKYAIETRKVLGENINKILLFIPPLPEWMIRELTSNNVFDISYITDDLQEVISNIEFHFYLVPHLIDSFAVRIVAGDKIFAYSSDSGYCTRLEEVAKSSDMFLCESTFINNNELSFHHHMSAKSAGEIARKSGVKRLLLTHLSDLTLKDQYCNAAKLCFHNVEISEILKSYHI